ncbi:glycerophosphodiester phosphodiesterase family protein [Shewanella sp.]|uniref:glycerophosphodiester phosphodiesterase family protein n=1 Tax=Shewanella sp. TaxID=50422 RepID=UPI001EB9F9D7|nr:glycerophosphodiester phosphodiesterase family protein [Shewanella sp.]NRB24515.1 glycerophosphodiester phosphodiesterase family protein [Shewanella sp.]
MINKLILLALCTIQLACSGSTHDLNSDIVDVPGNHALSIRQSIIEKNQTRVLVAAHRGAHNDLPENSIAAIKEAIRLGVDIIEIDVRLTQDNQLVLMHDSSLDRTTNGSGDISALTFQQVRTFRLKNSKGSTSELTEHQVPTLREALLAARGKIFTDLDLKSSSPKTLELLAELVNELGMNEQITAYHKDINKLKRLQAAIPGSLMLPIAMNHQHAIAIATENDFHMVHLRPHYADKKLMAELDSLSNSGWLNALGDSDKQAIKGDFSGYEQLISSGVDIIQTDQPALLLEYLYELGLRPDFSAAVQ